MKKRLFLWCAGIVVVVAAVLIWGCSSEYGTGYSEEQRRNWNEMVSSAAGENRVYGELLSFNSPFAAKMKIKRSVPDAPVWKVEIPAKCEENLSLEGMSVLMLRQLADKGNGDACLELVFRECQHEIYDDTSDRRERKFIFPNVEFVYYMERYLKRAVEAHRTGADFLLCLFESRKNGAYLPMKDIEGYKAFVSLLDEGDFALAKVAIYFDLDDGDIWNRVRAGLQRKAALGDVVARRNVAYWMLFERLSGRISAHWALLSPNNYFPWYVSPVGESLNAVDERFPDWSPEIMKMQESLIKWGTTRAWKEIQSQMKVPLAMLCEASDMGDLHAKFLWCWYTFNCQYVFSRDEWERYVKNVGDLAKAGGMYGELLLERELLPGLVCYQEKSVQHVLELMDKRRERAEGMSREVGMESFCDNDFFNIVGEGYVSEEEKAHLFRKLEKGAEEGNPLIMVCLAILLERGKDMPEDVTRAWDLLQKAKAWRDGIRGEIEENNTFVHHYNRNGGSNPFWNYWEEALPWQMIDIVTRRGDMPGMTVQQAFDLFMRKLNGRLYRANHPEAVKILEDQFEKRGFKIPDEKK